MRLFCLAVFGGLIGVGQAQTDTTLWTKSFYAPNNETVLKVDANDIVYLGYISGSPSSFTLKKFSPDGTALWSRSIPYAAYRDVIMAETMVVAVSTSCTVSATYNGVTVTDTLKLQP